MLSAGRLESPQSKQLLAQVCGQLQERAATHPELGIAVELSDTDGTVDFGWARCNLQATPDALEIRIEAPDADDVDRLRELLTRHLDRHGAGERLVWDGGESPAPDDKRRKDLMRSFHRRARH